jgi:hypothetical protein
MEDLLWEHPEKLLGEQLKQFRRQPRRSGIGQADIVFTDRLGRLLVIELKRGKLSREAIGQLHDYFGMLKKEFPDRSVELMAVANEIPPERRIACEQYNIEPREISNKKFRDVANEVGYVFQSEQVKPLTPVNIIKVQAAPSKPSQLRVSGIAHSGMERNAANITIRRRVRAWCKRDGIPFDVYECDRMIMDGKNADEIYSAFSSKPSRTR